MRMYLYFHMLIKSSNWIEDAHIVFFFFCKACIYKYKYLQFSNYIYTVFNSMIKYIVIVVYLVYIYDLIVDVYFVKLYKKVTEYLSSQLRG